MSGKVGDNFFRASGVVATAAEEYDDDQIQSNIAMLGFYVSVNGSLVRYNLVDQSIDEFFDTSGVDASASTNERRVASGSNYYYDGATVVSPTVVTDANSTAVDGDYTVYKWTTATGTGDYTTDTTQDHTWLVVAGGGGGGAGTVHSGVAGGAGGAGGYRTGASLELTADVTYAITMGAGGAGDPVESDGRGVNGTDSTLSGTGITTVTSAGGGGGGTRMGNESGAAGGSGGGGTTGGSAGAATSITPISGETTTIQGNAGGTPSGANWPGSGGGHTAAGTSTGTNAGAVGGAGTANDIVEDETDVYYAGGGGAGSADTTQAAGGVGGGGAGGQIDVDDAAAGTANTGGGGGGAGVHESGAAGGSGIVVLRRLTDSSTTAGADLTLQSTDVTALSAPSYGEFVTLIENAYGTATLNTDIKGYISRDSGTTFTQGTLVDEGTWGTNKKILGFHDLSISSQPSSTAMCYKITTHNQSASSKETRIYATSIGWR